MAERSKLLPWSQWSAVGSLLLLICVCIGWELWWAPLRLGGSYLVLKALPLLLPLRGLLHGRRYTAQWACLFILFWLVEGLVRSWSDRGLSQGLALLEVVLTLACFASLLAFARLSGRTQQQSIKPVD